MHNHITGALISGFCATNEVPFRGECQWESMGKEQNVCVTFIISEGPPLRHRFWCSEGKWKLWDIRIPIAISNGISMHPCILNSVTCFRTHHSLPFWSKTFMNFMVDETIIWKLFLQGAPYHWISTFARSSCCKYCNFLGLASCLWQPDP